MPTRWRKIGVGLPQRRQLGQRTNWWQSHEHTIQGYSNNVVVVGQRATAHSTQQRTCYTSGELFYRVLLGNALYAVIAQRPLPASLRLGCVLHQCSIPADTLILHLAVGAPAITRDTFWPINKSSNSRRRQARLQGACTPASRQCMRRRNLIASVSITSCAFMG